jgi:cyanophycinase
MGVDEDTAAVVTFDGERQLLDVIGRGAVTIFDPARVVTDAHEAPRSRPLLTSGVVLHVLPAGARFDLTARTLITRQPVLDESEAHEIAEAGRDLRRLARDIAAGDASPSVLRRRLARSRKRTTPRQNGEHA